MSVPIKHHYVPQFYLEGFVNEDEKFWVYDKVNDKIFGSSPANSFFEKKRNTLNKGSEDEDHSVEELYSLLEDRFAPAVRALRELPSGQELPDEPLAEVLLFASNLLWRVPAQDEEHEALIQQRSLRDLGIEIRHKVTGESLPEELLMGLQEDEGMKLMLKISNALLPFKGSHFKPEWGNWKLPVSPGKLFLCSDNPVITRKQNPILDITRELILPVASDRYLINTRHGIKKDLGPSAGLLLNACIAKNARRFICGPDKRMVEYARHVLTDPDSRSFLDEITDLTFRAIDQEGS